MATYEYASIQLDDDKSTPDQPVATVRGTAGLTDEESAGIHGLPAVKALNALGADGWRPFQRDDYSARATATVFEVYHLVRSSDDVPGGERRGRVLV